MNNLQWLVSKKQLSVLKQQQVKYRFSLFID